MAEAARGIEAKHARKIKLRIWGCTGAPRQASRCPLLCCVRLMWGAETDKETTDFVELSDATIQAVHDSVEELG